MAKPCLAASISSEKYDTSVSQVSSFLLWQLFGFWFCLGS